MTPDANELDSIACVLKFGQNDRILAVFGAKWAFGNEF